MASRTLLALPLLAGALLASFWLGARSRGEPGEPATTRGGDAPPRALDDDSLRRIVREELEAERARAGTATRVLPAASAELESPAGAPVAPPDDAPAAAPVDEAWARQAASAAELVANSVRVGRWTADDRARFAAATAALPPQVVVELQRSVFAAINRGQLTPSDGLPPFLPGAAPAAASAEGR